MVNPQLFLLIFHSTLTHAASYQTGLDAYKQGHYAEAMKHWKPLAKQGISETVYNLGPINSSHLVREQLNAMAQFNLGIIYLKGQGVEIDYAESHYWFNLAAHQLQHAKQKKQAAKLRDDTAKKLTKNQLEEAEHRFRQWKPVLATDKEQKFAPFGRGF